MPDRREPSLTELLSDPIVRQLMARDGTSEQQVRSIVLSARQRIAGRCRQIVASQAAHSLSKIPLPRPCQD